MPNKLEEEIIKQCINEFNEDTLVSAHVNWTPKAIQDFILSSLKTQREKLLSCLPEKSLGTNNPMSEIDRYLFHERNGFNSCRNEFLENIKRMEE